MSLQKKRAIKRGWLEKRRKSLPPRIVCYKDRLHNGVLIGH